MNAYHYKPEVLEELERFGLLPQPTTDPALIREFLTDTLDHHLCIMQS